MAENKNKIIVYRDWITTFESLQDDEAGRLIKHFFRYVNDLNPESPDRLTSLLFEPIKQTLKRDLKKYEVAVEKFSMAGKMSAYARLLSKPQIYVLRLYSDSEEFIKVGYTSESVSRRYSSGEGNTKNMPYRFEILYQLFENGNSEGVGKIEELVRKKFLKYSYIPSLKFGGYNECYTLSSVNYIIKYLTTFNDVEKTSTKSTVSDNVSVNVSDINNNNKDSEIKISVPSKIDFIDQVIWEFKKVYELANNLPYSILNPGKERNAVGKLLREYKKVHPDHDSAKTIAGLSEYFEKVVKINDSWLRSNMSLSLLMSKFNEINNILRNGKHTSNKGCSDKEFLSTIAQHLTGK